MDTPAPTTLSLRHVFLLGGLPRERIESVAHRCHWRSVAAGETVVSRQADEADVFFLVSGRVRVAICAANGREVAFRDYGEGEYFGEVAAIDSQPRSADVIALEPSVLASLGQQAFWQLLGDEPTVARRVMECLASLVRQLSQRVIELSTLPVPLRLQAELLRMAREAGVAHNQARIEPLPRHAELASRIGTYREQVTRELSMLVRRGLAAKDGKALVIGDVQRLEQVLAAAGAA